MEFFLVRIFRIRTEYGEILYWSKHIDQLICTSYKKLFVLKKLNDLRPKKQDHVLLKL